MSTESIMNNGCAHNWEFQAVFPENFAQWVCKNCNLVRAQNLAHMMNDLCTAQALASKYEDLQQELENERMRLAACSVAACGGALNPDGMYTSASMKEVIDLHDKYMKAREELDNGHAFLSALGVPNVDIQSASHAVFLPLRERLHTCHTWLAELQSIRQEKPFGLGSAKL